MNSKFEQDIERGKLGEEEVIDFLLSTGTFYKCEDVRENKLFQDLDVDYLLYQYNKPTCMIEVKTDYVAHRTGNIVFEHTSNKTANTIGCFRKTKADKLLYFISKTATLYILNMREFREYVFENKSNFTEVNMGDDARGYLISIKEHIENKPFCKKIVI